MHSKLQQKTSSLVGFQNKTHTHAELNFPQPHLNPRSYIFYIMRKKEKKSSSFLAISSLVCVCVFT